MATCRTSPAAAGPEPSQSLAQMLEGRAQSVAQLSASQRPDAGTQTLAPVWFLVGAEPVGRRRRRCLCRVGLVLPNGQVLFSQLRAGMWRRNGDTLVRNAWFYRSRYFYDFGFDLDIFLLQVRPWLWTGPPAQSLPCNQLRCAAGGGGTACALVGLLEPLLVCLPVWRRGVGP